MNNRHQQQSKNPNPGRQFGATYKTALPVQPIYRKNGPNGPNGSAV